MEDDKKKRKKKNKKKNKQSNEPIVSDTPDTNESTSDSQSHVGGTGADNNGQEIVDVSLNITRGHIIPDGDGNLDNAKEVCLAEAEKQDWLDRDASLNEKIKELQSEKDAQIHKEAFLEERIKQLMKEKDGNSEKEARLKERLIELEKEKDELIQKEGSLEQKIQQLQREMGAQLQKEVSFEQRIQYLEREMDAQLQKVASVEKEMQELKDEKNSWVQKEAGFELKFNQMVDEASLLNLKLVNLEENVKDLERERDSWILKKNSDEESIASLNIDNTKLKAQVVELELSKESLFSETQQLKEFISDLQLRINHLEMDKKTSENGLSNSELEGAPALVEGLVAKNSELIEEDNKLHAEVEQSGVRNEQFSSDGSVRDLVSGASKMIPVADSNQSLEDFMVKDESNGELVNATKSSEISEAGQTVEIQLEENEVKESTVIDEEEVSLTDSPLIGAPFRMISFVARYVSGADLVHKK